MAALPASRIRGDNFDIRAWIGPGDLEESALNQLRNVAARRRRAR